MARRKRLGLTTKGNPEWMFA